jgi:hypothetical protein
MYYTYVQLSARGVADLADLARREPISQASNERRANAQHTPLRELIEPL